MVYELYNSREHTHTHTHTHTHINDKTQLMHKIKSLLNYQTLSWVMIMRVYNWLIHEKMWNSQLNINALSFLLLFNNMLHVHYAS